MTAIAAAPMTAPAPDIAVAAPAAAPRGVAATTLRVAAGMLAGAAVVAAVVAVVCPGAARGWLAYPFSGVPNAPKQALAILVANLRLAGGVGAAAAIAQLRHRDGGAHRGLALAGRVCDVGVALALAGNLLVVGTATGAYGQRMVLAMLPHGPLELAAFSLVLTLHLRARRGLASRSLWLGTTVAVVVILAVAAVLETYCAGL